jgi:hypothetical protein
MAMRRPLCAAFGRPNAAFGCRGDLNHFSGYHRSYAFIIESPYSRYRWDDYSVRQALDTTNIDRHICSAFDLVPGDWGSAENRRRMVAITTRVHNAAKARDVRLRALREFAGTLDGRTVVTFYCDGGEFKTPFDGSHLDHAHGSFWRSRAKWDHSGIVKVMIGASTTARKDDDMMWISSLGPRIFVCNGLMSREINGAQFEIIKARAVSEGLGTLWNNGQVRANWDPNLDGPLHPTLDLDPAELAQIAQAAREGAQEGSAGATVDEVRKVVDEELDEAFGAAKDNDPA